MSGYPVDCEEKSRAIPFSDTTTDHLPSEDGCMRFLGEDRANCILISEGSATIRDLGIDLVATCPFFNETNQAIEQRIVLLRSVDSGFTFEFVATLLTPQDAPDGVEYYSAPALIAKEDNAPILLATPVVNGLYSGSVVFAFSNETNSELFLSKDTEHPQITLFTSIQTSSNLGGAGTFARGTGELGILQSEATPDPGGDVVNTQFRIISTGTLQSR